MAEAGETATDTPVPVSAAPAAEDAEARAEPVTKVTIAVMVVSVALSCACVCVECVEIIPGTVLGWIGRGGALLVAVMLTVALSLLAIPTAADKEDDGKGAQPEALTRIPRSVRDSWPWRALLCFTIAWDVFLTYGWVSSLVSGDWPSVANDAALGGWASWLVLAFLWAGKTPPKLSG